MILIIHNNKSVISVTDVDTKVEIPFESGCISKVLRSVSRSRPNVWILWAAAEAADSIDLSHLQRLLVRNNIMASYSGPGNNYLPREIGYIFETPFIKIRKSVCYPTWQMSSVAGGMHAAILNQVDSNFPDDPDFSYFLNSIAILAMPQGLQCYSDPNILIKEPIGLQPGAGIFKLFRFVSQHARRRWTFLMFLNLIVYERRFAVLPLLFTLFYRSRNLQISISEESKNYGLYHSVDVIIPTIGRKQYLRVVLENLAAQDLLPARVIVVEQNPAADSESDLDFITDMNWPFEIKHIFTRKAGACHARNLAIGYTSSDWVFLADDDIEIEPDFISEALSAIMNRNVSAATFRCYQEGEQMIFPLARQWESFGSGCSIVSGPVLRDHMFDTAFEFGFGEDIDFGRQLRNNGFDIIYFPEPAILHIKAPIGGFRTRYEAPWSKEIIQPKPAPTILLLLLKHQAPEQIRAYKTTLFFKFYQSQHIRNPFHYYRAFRMQWRKSVYWAHALKRSYLKP